MPIPESRNVQLNQVVDLAEIVDLMLDAVCVVDKFGYFLYVSSAFEDIFGYAPQEVVNRNALEFVFAEDRHKTQVAVKEALDGSDQHSFENRWTHKSGRIVEVLWSARWSEAHQVRIAVAHDISNRKKMERQLQYSANHDSLTNLPNRAFLEQNLTRSLTNTENSKGNVCLFFIDIDKFKQINDSHGHIMGDEVLRIIAERLAQCVRASDMVGRLAGDEFLVILNEIENEKDALLLAQKICSVAEQVISVNKVTLQLTVSVGIAFCRNSINDSKELLQRADKAMYEAKRAGGNRVYALVQ
jgi:diguanylate cyclase (GGDEF)-like protein/PAS domain S-box-containing protein